MQVATNVPIAMDHILNVKILSIINVILGISSSAVEIALSAIAKQNAANSTLLAENEIMFMNSTLMADSRNYGAGLWCGIIFILAGAVALTYYMNIPSKSFKLVAFVLTGMAIACGFVQMGISSAAIGKLRLKKQICTDVYIHPKYISDDYGAGFLVFLKNVIREVNTDLCLISIILSCSLLAVVANCALYIALYVQSKFTLTQPSCVGKRNVQK